MIPSLGHIQGPLQFMTVPVVPAVDFDLLPNSSWQNVFHLLSCTDLCHYTIPYVQCTCHLSLCSYPLSHPFIPVLLVSSQLQQVKPLAGMPLCYACVDMLGVPLPPPTIGVWLGFLILLRI